MSMVVNDYAFMGALITGSLISFWIDKIPLWGTKIPLYGYCSTVVFTEHNHEASVWSNYLTLLLLKGAIYLGLFLLLSKMVAPKSKSRGMGVELMH
jgi:hypothetical protein